MKNLLLILFAVVALASFSEPAKADCQSWETEVDTAAWQCGDFGQGWTCFQFGACQNPDGSWAQDGDGWDQYAAEYEVEFGYEPDAVCLVQFRNNFFLAY